jgi:ketosteroid isomerase-like protein
MLADSGRLILNDAYAAWESGDLLNTLSYCRRSVVFAVHASPGAASLIGAGIGRDNFGDRLETFLRLFEVQDFKLQQVTANGLWLHSRAYFRYRHRASRMEVDGTMRHKWLFVGDEIAHFELFHDSPRMRAFYAMVARESAS